MDDVLKRLRSKSHEGNIKGMKRSSINTVNALGVRVPDIRGIAKSIGRDHFLALALWRTGIKEARILASMIDDPDMVTERQMDKWANDFDSWDLCDQCCGNLFDRTRFAHGKAMQWPKSEKEYVKRAGFVMMACLAVHDKKMKNTDFLVFLPVIEKESIDERNFVKKAVNWALRQIGKRNKILNKSAISACKRIKAKDSRSARWIASDAARELRSNAVKGMLNEH